MRRLDALAVEHMLPVISQAQIYQRLQQGIPYALFSPTPEPDIDRFPLAVAFMHVPSGATRSQNMQHTSEKLAIVFRWTCPASTLRRQKRTNHRPFLIRQIASCLACSLCPLSQRQEVK
ncbi:MAG: hypothetical protein ABF968_00105 [Acetobacter sp.]